MWWGAKLFPYICLMIRFWSNFIPILLLAFWGGWQRSHSTCGSIYSMEIRSTELYDISKLSLILFSHLLFGLGYKHKQMWLHYLQILFCGRLKYLPWKFGSYHDKFIWSFCLVNGVGKGIISECFVVLNGGDYVFRRIVV